MTTEVTTLFDALPEGIFTGIAHGSRYIVTKSALSEGKAQKLVAEELGGGDYISMNLYRLAEKPVFKPCEMSEGKVIAFLADLVPDEPPN